MSRMNIDCERVSDIIVTFINDEVVRTNKKGVCIGISGGVDSAVAVTLAVKAMNDTSRVHGLHLFDRDTEKKFTEYAEMLVKALGINFQKIDITPLVKEQDTYKPAIMKIIPYSTLVNKLILFGNIVGSRLFYGESPFVVTLKREDPANLKMGFIAKIAKDIETSFNVRHTLRRKLLEEYAENNNLLLIGASNRSESFVGWFVKDGVDDLPIEVLLALYKNQVRQLAKFLKVPDCILNEAPSPDMFKGIGDEDIIGHTYDVVDKVAYVIENGINEKALLNEGITQKEIDHIKKLHELSHWKRENKHKYPVLDSKQHNNYSS
ncbi:MAG: NAD(+) synthase [Candidatus Bathyarchaeota archaeon]|nr:NAD(+) synthase [Candidatus Bathyarchaeota archaeon]